MTVANLIAQPLAHGLDLDSDQVEAALTHADLNPQTCTLWAALTACREYANAAQAFRKYPTRGGKRPGSGAPIGNSNGRKEIVRDISLVIRLSGEEHDKIAAATDGKKLSTWLREIALAAACIGNEKVFENKKVSFKMTQLTLTTDQMMAQAVKVMGTNDYITQPQHMDINQGQTLVFLAKGDPDTFNGESVKFTRVDDTSFGNSLSKARWRKA